MSKICEECKGQGKISVLNQNAQQYQSDNYRGSEFDYDLVVCPVCGGTGKPKRKSGELKGTMCEA